MPPLSLAASNVDGAAANVVGKLKKAFVPRINPGGSILIQALKKAAEPLVERHKPRLTGLFRKIPEHQLIPQLLRELHAAEESGGYSGTNMDLIRDVAEKILVTPPQVHSWLNKRAKEELRLLPLREAIETASLGVDATSLSKANTVIAQLAHCRIADGTLTSDELRNVMLTSIEQTKGACSEEDVVEIDKIITLTEECARFRALPFDVVDTFADGGELIRMTMRGEREVPEYTELNSLYEKSKKQDPLEAKNLRKKMKEMEKQGANFQPAFREIYSSYMAKKKANRDRTEGLQSVILNSRYPARTLIVRMRSTLAEMQALIQSDLPRESPAGHYLRIVALTAIGMYYPLMDRFGWHQAKEHLGELVMEALEPGAHSRIKRQIHEKSDDLFKQAKEIIEELARQDSQIKKWRVNNGIHYKIKNRKKPVFSVWLKLFNDAIEKGNILTVGSLHDVFGLRVVFDFVSDRERATPYASLSEPANLLTQACQHLAGLIFTLSADTVTRFENSPVLGHAVAEMLEDAVSPQFVNVAQSFAADNHIVTITKDEDYIADPKANGYQTHQMRVRFVEKEPGDDGRLTGNEITIEIQIRTQQMDDDANFGRADHGVHKLNQTTDRESDLQQPQDEPGLAVLSNVVKDTLKKPRQPRRGRSMADVIKNHRIMRGIAMMNGLDERLRPDDRRQRSGFKQSEKITVRTKHGKYIDLPRRSHGKELNLLDQIYLISRAVKRPPLISNFTGVVVNGVEHADFSSDEAANQILNMRLKNGDSIEILTAEEKTLNRVWQDHCVLNDAIKFIDENARNHERSDHSRPIRKSEKPVMAPAGAGG